jgi:hypothetical protein
MKQTQLLVKPESTISRETLAAETDELNTDGGFRRYSSSRTAIVPLSRAVSKLSVTVFAT